MMALLSGGEKPHLHFWENMESVDQAAQEIVDFSNAMGGIFIIGVSGNGQVKGLNDDDIRRLDRLVRDASKENVKPQVFPTIEILLHDNKRVMLVTIPYGQEKPYVLDE